MFIKGQVKFKLKEGEYCKKTVSKNASFSRPHLIHYVISSLKKKRIASENPQN